MRRAASYLIALCSVVAGVGLLGCDSAVPDDPEPTLVVEGFIDTGRPAPAIRLSRTTLLTAPYNPSAAAVTDADVSVTIDSRVIGYAADVQMPGLFRPMNDVDLVAEPGAAFSLAIEWNGARATSEGIVPVPIRLLAADVVVPDEPVSAVLLDSLLLSDSLAVGAYEGFIYPIEVSLTWESAADPGAEFWIRTQLRPYSTFPSTVVDLFLRSEAIFREDDVGINADGTRTWTGVYAVGVNDGDEPLPVHDLRIAIIRSGRDYARFASSRGTPDRREPISNLNGAIGIFTAISVDSTRVPVGAAH